MNYPEQNGQRPGTRRGPNFFLLFMMAMMALFLYTQYQRGLQQAANPGGSESGTPDIQIPDISNDNRPAGWPTPDAQPGNSWAKPAETNPHSGGANSDWKIEDVPTHDPHQTDIVAPASKDKVTSGDWSIEEGRSRPKDSHSDLKPSSPKTTRKGDWSLGEVETSPR